MTRRAPFRSLAAVAAYLDHDRIECLECGRRFAYLGPHLRQTHQLTVHEYRHRWGLPRLTPLAGRDLRDRRSATLTRERREGVITPATQGRAVTAARQVPRPPLVPLILADATERMRRVGRSNRTIGDTGRYSDGGSARRHRERNAAVRAARRGDFTALDAYNARYGSHAGRRIPRPR